MPHIAMALMVCRRLLKVDRTTWFWIWTLGNGHLKTQPTLFSFFFRYKHLHGFVEMDIFSLGVLAFG